MQKISKKRQRKNKKQPATVEQLPKKPKVTVNYFDDRTEQYIVRFQKEPDIQRQKDLYLEGIQPAFAKLVENVINVYRFSNIDNVDILKNDCISFLFEVLRKFDVSKGHKAFSYFNVIAKNFFIQRVKVSKKKNNSDVELDKVMIGELEKSGNFAHNFEDNLVNAEFTLLLKEEIKKWRVKFEKKQEKLVLEAVILLLCNPDLISLGSKKAIYLYLREITSLNTKQIVKNLTKIRRRYENFKKRYYNGDV